MKKPTVILFFYRFMEFRLFFQTGLLNLLADKVRTVVVVPEESVRSVLQQVPPSVVVEATTQGKKTVRDEFKGRGISSIVSRILAFVYATPSDGEANITPALHFAAIRKQVKKRGLRSRISTELLIAAATFASRQRWVRSLLQSLFARTAYEPTLESLFQKHSPNLAVVGSFGVSADGLAMLEAKRQGVPVCVVLQTWDRTSTKGYPTVPPDFALTWSNVTANEAIKFLDVKKENVFIDGAPMWDSFFTKEEVLDRVRFCNLFGLNLDKPIIYVAMNSLAYHQGNLNLLRELAAMVGFPSFGGSIQMLIRLHPSYFSAQDEKVEMDALIDEISTLDGVFINRPSLVSEQDGLVFTREDLAVQSSSFQHSSLTISVISTYMIESAIFDKPAINIEAGRWQTNLYDIAVSDYQVHHLKRIYDYDAVYRVSDLSDLPDLVDHILRNPEEKAVQRAQLVDTEIPVNRGCATEAFANRIYQLATPQD